MRFLLIIIVLLSACSSRQVGRYSSKQLEKLKVDQSANTEAFNAFKTIDQTEMTTAFVDRSKVFQDDETAIKADSAVYDSKTGKMNFWGKINIRVKKRMQTENDKKSETITNNNVRVDAQTKTKSDSKISIGAEAVTELNRKESKSEGSPLNTLWFYILVIMIIWAGVKFGALWK